MRTASDHLNDLRRVIERRRAQLDIVLRDAEQDARAMTSREYERAQERRATLVGVLTDISLAIAAAEVERLDDTLRDVLTVKVA